MCRYGHRYCRVGYRHTLGVQASPRGGRTKITITENLTGTVGVSVGLRSLLLGLMVVPIVEFGLTALLPAVGIVGVGGVAAIRKHFKGRETRLTALLDRLTVHVSGTANKLPKGAG